MYHFIVFNMLGKIFFPTIFTIFIKKKFSFCCFLDRKFIKFCQGRLGLGPAGPCDNQALLLPMDRRFSGGEFERFKLTYIHLLSSRETLRHTKGVSLYLFEHLPRFRYK